MTLPESTVSRGRTRWTYDRGYDPFLIGFDVVEIRDGLTDDHTEKKSINEAPKESTPFDRLLPSIVR